MQYTTLGTSDIKISKLCIGTMLWGTQNTFEDAKYQMDAAIAKGVNFADTAEIYPVNPMSVETQRDSERILGRYLNESKNRDKIVVATKIAGAGLAMARNGGPITSTTMREAIEQSLKCLQTDYIDLYQLHWPNRGSYHFRQNWQYDPTHQNKAETLDHMQNVLEFCAILQKEGKVRAFGLSNETAWGTTQWVRIAEQYNLPRMVSIQNEYSLMCRLFDTDMAEVCHNENIGLLSYSPLAAGILSGKYLNNQIPEGSRASIIPGISGRLTMRAHEATAAYIEIAQKHGYDPCQMALAWCHTRPFMASAIFGARTKKQLNNILNTADLTLSQTCLNDIETVYKKFPIPY